MKTLLAAAVLVASAAALAQPAQADWGRGYHRHWRGGGGVVYLGPPVVVYPPPPMVVYQAPPPYASAYPSAPVQAVPVSPPYTDGYGRYCREYQSTMVVGGMPQPGYGTACMQPDGSWQIVR
jgi:hypothetical protein